MTESFDESRGFLKADLWYHRRSFETDQRRGVPMPPVQLGSPPDAPVIKLPAVEGLSIGQMPLAQAIAQRQSHRRFRDEPLSLDELSFLLWATQGVRGKPRENAPVLRTVPSAGCRHPFETYLVVRHVEGVDAGIYRYLPLEHQLGLLRAVEDLSDAMTSSCMGQSFVADGAVVLVWTVLPYRSEWRYGPVAHKVIAIDVGHVCQNLYLACEALGLGTCAIGAYDQEQMDALVGVDGQDEFTVYLAPVGRPA
ncbi:MAG TPA: SagB/ThcOx family dehydrogenase [Chloroflexi bacterium]|jgi:SagB-type dehydrogenase family enzyme|nr:SagB/ThcOx family dehydrogenase [Chloroflexota bacterium]